MKGLRIAFTALFSTAALGLGAVTAAPAAALSSCDSSATSNADISISQNNTAPGQYTLVVANHGPCNVAPVVVYDTLPGGLTFASQSGNPNSWTCSSGGSQATCTLTATIGVSGFASITLVASGTSAAANYASVSTPRLVSPDPTPDDNQSWGVFVPSSGATLTQPDPVTGSTVPSATFPQTTTVVDPSGNSGGTGFLQFAGVAPVSGAFGKAVYITTPPNSANAETIRLDWSVAIVPSAAQLGIGVWTLPDGATTWQQLPTCTLSQGALPCVQSVSAVTDPSQASLTNPLGIQRYEAVVSTNHTSSWTGSQCVGASCTPPLPNPGGIL